MEVSVKINHGGRNSNTGWEKNIVMKGNRRN